MPACPVGIPVCCGGNVASGMASLVHSSYGNNRLLQSMFLVLAPSSVLSCLATLRTSVPIRSEYFMVAPAEVTHDNFFAKSKQGQADLVWRGLFVERSPISEACQGVVTTLQKLGLEKQLAERDLTSIRQWFEAQRLDDHVEKVFQLANVRYAVMTNIPYVEEEAQHWRQNAPVATSRLRTALRIDTFLKGDWGSISKALRAEGLDETLEGAKEYLRKWARIYKPEYMMASTPHDWRYPEPPAVATMKPLVKAFAGFGAAELLEQVVAPLCQELSLPIALKLGAWRGMSPDLDPCCGGDGVAAADLASLQALCANFPKVKFLVTELWLTALPGSSFFLFSMPEKHGAISRG
ncbi:unnamed protein product [Effrenium voratum]|nr:unnamed protein product [Effrenium voratum]